MIVKCQRSVTTTEPTRQMFFYNRARDWEWMGELTPEWDALFSNTGDWVADNRFFAEVRWGEGGKPPEFIRRVSEQNW